MNDKFPVLSKRFLKVLKVNNGRDLEYNVSVLIKKDEDNSAGTTNHQRLLDFCDYYEAFTQIESLPENNRILKLTAYGGLILTLSTLPEVELINEERSANDIFLSRYF